MAYYALKKDVFDKSKITVVGSPTITSDGVASGFDSANANNIQIPTAIISQIATANTWKVEVSGTVQESGFTYGNIRTDNNIRYDLIQLNRYANGFIFVCCLDENGTATSKNIPITFSNTYNGKAYKATLEFTETKYIATVQFGDGKVLSNSLDSTYKIKFYNYGDKFELGYKCINGSINLPSFKIYVDNQLVFQPVKPTYLLERRKEGFDPSKFTVVGTPTISESGVASGFSGSNIVKSTKNIDLTTATSWSIKCRANVSSTAYSTIFSIPQDGKAVRLFTYNNSLRFNIPISGSDWGASANSNAVLNLNVDYYFKLELKNGYYTSYYSLDGIDFIQGATILKEHSVFQVNPIQIGGRNNTVDPFNGSINLPSISITVDGKEVFTGAKEVYYAMEK